MGTWQRQKGAREPRIMMRIVEGKARALRGCGLDTPGATAHVDTRDSHIDGQRDEGKVTAP